MNRRPDAETAAILDLVRMCQTLSVLPGPGGLLDQDAYFVFLLGHVLRADNERAELDRARARMGMH